MKTIIGKLTIITDKVKQLERRKTELENTMELFESNGELTHTSVYCNLAGETLKLPVSAVKDAAREELESIQAKEIKLAEALAIGLSKVEGILDND